jgi:hypothetical protein
MDNRNALHTAARRFCEDRHSDWTQAYSELEARENIQIEKKFEAGWEYSEEAYGVFPRYRLDKAIRVEVERLEPQSSSSLEELRLQLISASDIAEARLRAGINNAIAWKALREEAEDYRTYIRALSERDLLSIAPLPFRRVISVEESKELRNQLKMVWDIGGSYWFPLKEGPIPPSVLAFHVEYYEKMNGLRVLHEALMRRGISRVFELHEFDPDEPDKEIELSILKPAYLWGGEQCCTDKSVDWVVYASHESSITIAGEWLTQIFKKKWPEWAQKSYGGPYSTKDLRGTWKWEGTGG